MMVELEVLSKADGGFVVEEVVVDMAEKLVEKNDKQITWTSSSHIIIDVIATGWGCCSSFDITFTATKVLAIIAVLAHEQTYFDILLLTN